MNYFLCYQIGRAKFATAIEEVKEIARTKNLITARELPKNITGFFDLRGRRICVFNLPLFLEIETDNDFEIILSEMHHEIFGFKVEKILNIVSTEAIFPYPEFAQARDYLKGIIKQDGQILQVISFFKILSGARLKAIQKYL